MKKYKVNFSMTVTNHYSLIVEADDEEDAFDIACNDFDEIEDRLLSECDSIANDGVEEINKIIKTTERE